MSTDAGTSIPDAEWWFDAPDVMNYYKKSRAPFMPALLRFVDEDIVPKLIDGLDTAENLRDVLELGAGAGQFWDLARPSFLKRFPEEQKIPSWLQTDANVDHLRARGESPRDHTKVVDLKQRIPFEDGSVRATVSLAALDTVPVPELERVMHEVARVTDGPVVFWLDVNADLRQEVLQARREGWEAILNIVDIGEGVPWVVGVHYVDWRQLKQKLGPKIVHPIHGDITAPTENEYFKNPELVLMSAINNPTVFKELKEINEWIADEAKKIGAWRETIPSVATRHFERLKENAEMAGIQVDFAGPVNRQYVFERSEMPDFPEESNEVIYRTGWFAYRWNSDVAEGRVRYDFTVHALYGEART
jgi:hypothetical protein